MGQQYYTDRHSRSTCYYCCYYGSNAMMDGVTQERFVFGNIVNDSAVECRLCSRQPSVFFFSSRVLSLLCPLNRISNETSLSILQLFGSELLSPNSTGLSHDFMAFAGFSLFVFFVCRKSEGRDHRGRSGHSVHNGDV